MLTLEDCDMALGLDWMEQHNPICFDLKSRQIMIQLEGEIVVLKAIKEDKASSY